MSTLSDVTEFRVNVWLTCELHGTTAEFEEKFSRRFRELGDTIRFEEGYTIEEAKRVLLNFSPNMKLGPKAEAEFQALREWVYSLAPFNTA